MAGRGRGTTWGMTTLIMLGDMFGLGALAMPSAFARLGGFIPGAAVVVLMCCIATYSGNLYSRLMSVPLRRQRGGRDAAMLDEVGAEALGRVGRVLVFVLAYLLILLVTALTTQTGIESLMRALDGLGWDDGFSRLYCTLAVAAVTWVLVQIRKLADVGWVTPIGTLSIIIAIVLALLKLLWLDGGHRHPKHGPHLMENAPLLPAAVASFDIVFGFAGQQNWPRFIGAMRGPRRNFARSVGVALPSIGIMLLAMGVLGYWKLGDNIDHSKPLTSILKQDAWAVVMNLGVCVHCIIATVLNLNTWTWSMMAIYFKTKNAHNQRHKGAASPHERLAEDPVPIGNTTYIPTTAGAGAWAGNVEEGRAHDDSMRAPLMGQQGTDDADDDGGESGEVKPDPSSASRWPWLGLSAVGMAVAALVAYFVPFFSELMGLVGAVGDVAVMITLPTLFAVLLLPKHERVPRWERCLLLALLVASIAGATLGCTASVWQMRAQTAEG